MGSWNLGLTEKGGNEFYLSMDGALVYRLGHGPLKAERRVQFPCALPLPSQFNPPAGFDPVNTCRYNPSGTDSDVVNTAVLGPSPFWPLLVLLAGFALHLRNRTAMIRNDRAVDVSAPS